MNLRKIDQIFLWILFFIAVVVTLLLLLVLVAPVGAASTCGPLVGPAAMVETSLITAKIPHVVIEDKLSYAVCLRIGCPKPRSTCLGWRIRLDTMSGRWVDLAFSKTGVFRGLR